LHRFAIAVLAAAALFNWTGTERAAAASQVCLAWHADVVENDVPDPVKVPSRFECSLRSPESAVTVIASGDWQMLIWLDRECGMGGEDLALSSASGDNNMPGGSNAVWPDIIPKGACAEGRVLSSGSTILGVEMPSGVALQ
jgi:hypothetical protein